MSTNKYILVDMFGDLQRSQFVCTGALFAAAAAAGSCIVIPFFPVPFTLQTLCILLCGCIMKQRGAYLVLLYILAGTAGLPLFHQFTSGPGILLGPTGGYILGFLPAVIITGYAFLKKNRAVRISALIVSALTIDLCGALWLSASSGLSITDALIIGVLPFIAADMLKAAAAYYITCRLEINEGIISDFTGDTMQNQGAEL